MFRLDGKTAVVTGAGSGIGLAASLLFGRRGASVAVVDANLSAELMPPPGSDGAERVLAAAGIVRAPELNWETATESVASPRFVDYRDDPIVANCMRAQAHPRAPGALIRRPKIRHPRGHGPNYAFIAMPMNNDDAALEDVLDAIKEGARRCEVIAERIDEPQTNERITDRVLASIRRARFVIADLTGARPNVYYEAGYAQALGKIPVYLARQGTSLQFDIQDYPVIFFRNLKHLKEALEQRLSSLIGDRES